MTLIRRFTLAALAPLVLAPAAALAQTAHPRVAAYHDHTPRVHDRSPRPHTTSGFSTRA